MMTTTAGRSFARWSALWGVAWALGGALACAVPVNPSSSSTRGGDPAPVRAALARAGRGGARARSTSSVGRWPSWWFARRGASLELRAYDLEGKNVTWRQRAAESRAGWRWPPMSSSTPTATGALVGRDVATGAVRWQRPPGFRLHPHGVRRLRQHRGGGGPDGRGQLGGARSRPPWSPTTPPAARSDSPGTSPARSARPAVWRNLVVVPRQSQWVTLRRRPAPARSWPTSCRARRRPASCGGCPRGCSSARRGSSWPPRRRRSPSASRRRTCAPSCRPSCGRCTTTTCTDPPRSTTRPSIATGCSGGPTRSGEGAGVRGRSGGGAQLPVLLRGRRRHAAACAGPTTSRARTPSPRRTPVRPSCS